MAVAIPQALATSLDATLPVARAMAMAMAMTMAMLEALPIPSDAASLALANAFDQVLLTKRWILIIALII